MNRCDHDISERDNAIADGMCPLCLADEIERLRAELKGLESWACVLGLCPGDAEIERLRARVRAALESAEKICDSYANENQRFHDENERLRSALEQIEVGGLGVFGAKEVARAALRRRDET